jgi:hypothetical protein
MDYAQVFTKRQVSGLLVSFWMRILTLDKFGGCFHLQVRLPSMEEDSARAYRAARLKAKI